MTATPLTLTTFLRVVYEVRAAGYGDDIRWSEDAGPPESPEAFAEEVIFVICNGGMKNTVARKIYDRVLPEVRAGRPAGGVFGHRMKAHAIDMIWENRHQAFDGYVAEKTDEGRIEYLGALRHIGKITKFHLAKNFGVDVAKPDVHLQRLADHHGETVQGLCDRLAEASRYKSRTVDVLLWRACAIGLIDSTTGEVRLP